MSQGINGRNGARLGEEMGCPGFFLHHSYSALASGSRIQLVPQADFSFRVMMVYAVSTSANAATFIAYNSTSATAGTGNVISGTITVAADATLYTAATMDDRYYDIHKGQGLAIDNAGGVTASAELYVMCVRI